MESEKAAQLRREIARLEKEISEAESRLPAHSVRPHQLIALEELEDELSIKKAALEKILKQM